MIVFSFGYQMSTCLSKFDSLAENQVQIHVLILFSSVNNITIYRTRLKSRTVAHGGRSEWWPIQGSHFVTCGHILFHVLQLYNITSWRLNNILDKVLLHKDWTISWKQYRCMKIEYILGTVLLQEDWTISCIHDLNQNGGL